MNLNESRVKRGVPEESQGEHYERLSLKLKGQGSFDKTIFWGEQDDGKDGEANSNMTATERLRMNLLSDFE